jgi:cytochrome P450
LSQHAGIDAAVAEEVETVIGSARPAFAHVDGLRLTRRVLEESLRLYPPAWGFSRRALEDDEVCGYRVRRGWLVFVIPFVVHRRPTLWPTPDRFDPERFLPAQVAERPRFSYIPFGAGPRGCVGHQFAMIEALLILATIAQRYQVEVLPGHAVHPEPLITLRPAPGIRAVVKKRTRPAADRTGA